MIKKALKKFDKLSEKFIKKYGYFKFISLGIGSIFILNGIMGFVSKFYLLNLILAYIISFLFQYRLMELFLSKRAKGSPL